MDGRTNRPRAIERRLRIQVNQRERRGFVLRYRLAGNVGFGVSDQPDARFVRSGNSSDCDGRTRRRLVSRATLVDGRRNSGLYVQHGICELRREDQRLDRSTQSCGPRGAVDESVTRLVSRDTRHKSGDDNRRREDCLWAVIQVNDSSWMRTGFCVAPNLSFEEGSYHVYYDCALGEIYWCRRSQSKYL